MPFSQFGVAATPVTRLQLHDSGLRIVGAFPDLHTLDDSHSLVSDHGVKTIVELQHLKKLDISGTSITPIGRAALKKALPECEIVCVNPAFLP